MKLPDVVNVIHHWFFILPFAGDWNYEDPNLWYKKNPQCGGIEQSPIALYSREAYSPTLLHIEFFNYRKPLLAPVDIINNGYSVEVGLRLNEDRTKPSLKVSSSDDTFEVQAVHFHWGSEGVKGSEHTIDGERYDLEMHIVHKNSRYRSVEEAREHPDGFVVLGVMFQAVPESRKHRTLDEIYKALGSVTKYNSTAELGGPITMRSFIPELDTQDFFSYNGSLTTPPCTEAVLWVVFTEILPISNEDLAKFWNLYDKKGLPLLNNYRPVQEQSNRRILRTRDELIFL